MVLFINDLIARGGRGVSQKMANDDMAGGGMDVIYEQPLYHNNLPSSCWVFLMLPRRICSECVKKR